MTILLFIIFGKINVFKYTASWKGLKILINQSNDIKLNFVKFEYIFIFTFIFKIK